MGVGSTVFKAGMAGLNAYGTYGTFKSSLEEGNGIVKTTAKVGFDMALWAVAPEVAWAKMGADMLKGGADALVAYGKGQGRQNAKSVNSVYRQQFGGNFVDTQNAQTMRQRGLQAIEQSGNNINSVFGSEARTFYRGMR